MPHASRWYIRASLVYFFVGFSLGALMLWNKGIPFSPHMWRLLPAHLEFLLLGWILLLALGVAYWILPRFRTMRPRTHLVWLAFWLINLGLWSVALANFLPASSFFSMFGRLAEVAGAVAFAVHAWPRIKPAAA